MSETGRLGGHRTLQEFRRYFGAGLAAFGSDFLLLVVLTEGLEVNYLASNIFGFLLGLFVSYVLSIKWVFEYRRFESLRQEMTLFVLLALVGLAVNEGILWLLVEVGALHYTMAKIAATGFVFVFNFVLRKAVLFHRHEHCGDRGGAGEDK